MSADAFMEHTPFAQVRRIAVVRGGGMGDLVMAMPAINALARAYPRAEITLLGMPAHAALLQNRRTCIARVEILPFAEGIRPQRGNEPPGESKADFLHTMRGRAFDLAVQLHGGGRFSNPFVLDLHARHTVGSRAPDAGPLERTVPHQYFQHEVLRGLEVAALAGAYGTRQQLRWQATDAELLQARVLLPATTSERPLALIHPGAQDPRRRWSAGNFAAVAAGLANEGCQILVVGDGTDVEVAQLIVAAARKLLHPGTPSRVLGSVAGDMDLGTFCGLARLSRVLVANDSGPRHVAEALGVPTAAIFWAPNMVNAGPLLRARHRVQIAWETRCPVCQCPAAGHVTPTCGHEGSFVDEVPAAAVLADAVALLAG